MKEAYVLVAAACENQNFRCIVLSDDDRPVILCSLPRLSKGKFRVTVNEIYRVDITDLNKAGGTADILEHITEAKELKQLRKAGLVPAEDDMPLLSASKPSHVKAAEQVRDAQSSTSNALRGEKRGSSDADVARRNAESEAKSDDDAGEVENPNGTEQEDMEVEEDPHRRLKKSEKKKIREDLKRQEQERKLMAPNLEQVEGDPSCNLEDL